MPSPSVGWTIPLLYVLIGRVRHSIALAVLTVGSWYLIDYFWPAASQAAFLLVPLALILIAAARIRFRIRAAREAGGVVWLDATRKLPADVMASLTRLLAEDWKPLRSFYSWLAATIRAGRVGALVSLSDLPGFVFWRTRHLLNAMGLIVSVAFVSVLGTSLLGAPVASAFDTLSDRSTWIDGIEICRDPSIQAVGEELVDCSWVQSEPWPDGSVEVKTDVPQMGLIRVHLSNWPRSGRSIRFRTQSLRILSEAESDLGSLSRRLWRSDQSNTPFDVEVSVDGRIVEFRYIIWPPENWAVSGELEYMTIEGGRLQRATLSGWVTRGAQHALAGEPSL